MAESVTQSFQQYEARLKTIAQTLLGGKKKQWLHNQRWFGDELGIKQRNPKADDYARQVQCKKQLDST